MPLKEIGAVRLANQQISRKKFSTPAEIAAWMGGLQAQDPAAIPWALGARLKGKPTQAQIERAMQDRSILRTWCMRGTIHLVAAEDAAWIIALPAPQSRKKAKPVERFAGLDEAAFAKSQRILARDLKGGEPMERDAIYALFEKSGIPITGQRGYYLLWRAGMSGLICFGPQLSRKPTFALLKDYAPKQREIKPQQAAAELARRYFQSRGPATVADWIWWSSLPPAIARAGHEEICSELVEDKINGMSYWLSPSNQKAAADGLTLLPGFDEFVLGYKDRSAVIEPKFASGIAYSNGIFFPVMVSKGQVVGVWKREMKNETVAIQALPFKMLSKLEKVALGNAAQKYANFLGQKLISEG